MSKISNKEKELKRLMEDENVCAGLCVHVAKTNLRIAMSDPHLQENTLSKYMLDAAMTYLEAAEAKIHQVKS